jgi:hypothetical protein
VWGRIRVIP